MMLPGDTVTDTAALGGMPMSIIVELSVCTKAVDSSEVPAKVA
jgi:hypothetical protein